MREHGDESSRTEHGGLNVFRNENEALPLLTPYNTSGLLITSREMNEAVAFTCVGLLFIFLLWLEDGEYNVDDDDDGYNENKTHRGNGGPDEGGENIGEFVPNNNRGQQSIACQSKAIKNPRQNTQDRQHDKRMTFLRNRSLCLNFRERRFRSSFLWSSDITRRSSLRSNFRYLTRS